MDAIHLTAGARGFERLVLDDQDRWDLLGRVRGALGGALLAYCVMDTHLHVVAEGAGGRLARSLDAALLAYARAFNRRHDRAGGLLRGRSVATPVPGTFELGRAIRYVHENPVSAGLVEDAIEWPWSSARAFAGLVRAGFAEVARARALVDPRAIGMLGRPVALADAGPAGVPEHGPEALLAAAAQALSLDAAALVGERRGRELGLGRALFVRLGLLEGYEHRQLAPVLGVTRQRITQHASKEVDPLDVRRARTLLRDPRLRSTLAPPRALPEPAARASTARALPAPRGRPVRTFGPRPDLPARQF